MRPIIYPTSLTTTPTLTKLSTINLNSLHPAYITQYPHTPLYRLHYPTPYKISIKTYNTLHPTTLTLPRQPLYPPPYYTPYTNTTPTLPPYPYTLNHYTPTSIYPLYPHTSIYPLYPHTSLHLPNPPTSIHP